MKKSLFVLVSLLIMATLLVACGGAPATPAPKEEPKKEEAKATEAPKEEAKATEAPKEEAKAESTGEKKTLKVWSFTNEINTMAIAYEGLHPDVDIVYTMIPMGSGEYQTKLKASLGTADAPDVIALEAAFVREYVESDLLSDIGSLMPDVEKAKVYPFVTDVGSKDGVLKALAYQATPGALFYRRSLAKQYFGTDDPDKIQALLADFDKFTAAAAVVKEKSAGNTYMVASSGDYQQLFFTNRAQPWIVDDALVIDPMVTKYVETAKLFRDEGYEAQAQQWQEGWFAGMNDSLKDAKGEPKQVFTYFLPTWGLTYVLAKNAASADGSTNTAGDWAVIPGPLPYQWGGTWLGTIGESTNQDLAKDFIRFATIDEGNLTNWATGVYSNEYLKKIDPAVAADQQQAAGDFVSSQVVVEKIIPSFDNSDLSKFLAGQNSYAGFAKAAPAVSAKLMTGSDDAIQRALNDPLNQYLNGKMTAEEMWTTWKDSLRTEFPDLAISDEVPASAPITAPKEEAKTESTGEKKTLKVWSFTNEINTMAIAYEGLNPDVDIVYTMIPMGSGEYQTKLKASLGTADAPDVIALEAAFVREYVESDLLSDIGSLMPDVEKAKIYPFVTDVGSKEGVLKALAYQATPGALFYRRSLAKQYFGTDDPDKIQALLADFDKFTAAAAVVKEKSAGNTYMVASSGDYQQLFFTNRAQPWIVDDALVIDPMVTKYIETAKLFRDEGYEAQAQQWQEGWFAGMNDSLKDAKGTPKQVFTYFLPTWGLTYVLAKNAASADGSTNTAGDWAVIPGPLPYQWGGTWLGTIAESTNQDLAKDFIRFATIDEGNLTNWATGVYSNEYLKKIDPAVAADQQQAAGDFVSSQIVVDKIIPSFDNSDLSKFLAGQNSYAGFAKAAPAVSAKLMTGSDDAIQRALNDPLNQYLNGKMTVEEMWTTWKDSLRTEFPDLTIK